MKKKLETYMKYMLKKKDFVLFSIREKKAKLALAKEDGSKASIQFYTDMLKEKEDELKMINEIIDYLQLEHYKYV